MIEAEVVDVNDQGKATVVFRKQGKPDIRNIILADENLEQNISQYAIAAAKTWDRQPASVDVSAAKRYEGRTFTINEPTNLPGAGVV
jgi:hypothetical protein